MNKKINFYNLFIGLIFFALVINVDSVMAQPDPGGGPTCWPPPCIPIDGGIGFLIAAGVAYGVKKTWDIKSAKER